DVLVPEAASAAHPDEPALEVVLVARLVPQRVDDGGHVLQPRVAVLDRMAGGAAALADEVPRRGLARRDLSVAIAPDHDVPGRVVLPASHAPERIDLRRRAPQGVAFDAGLDGRGRGGAASCKAEAR